MKKLRIILIVLILPLLLTGCTKKGSLTDRIKKDAGEQQEEQVSGTIFDIMKTGKSSKCTAKVEEDGNTIEMTTFVSGKNAYGETIITMPEGPEKKISMYTLINEDWMYMWGDTGGPATKMSVASLEEMNDNLAEDTEIPYDKTSEQYKDIVDYKCVPWIPNPSRFNPPSDIEFLDMSETMGNMMNMGGDSSYEDMTDMGCEMCEYLSSQEEIDACKAEIGCE